MTMIWEDPPVNSAKRNERQTFVEGLKTRPGSWARYPHTSKNPNAGSLNRRAFPGTEWTVRKREDGRYDLYARWIGETQ